MAVLLLVVFAMGNRPPRLPGFSYIGLHRYSLTICVHERRNVFTNAPLVAEMLRQISQCTRDWRFAIPAYCFMPDHLHLLAAAEADDSDLRQFAQRAKQRMGYAYRRTSRSHLWQDGYFEHVLRDDEVTETVARYILANPVRAGLCKEPDQYPFSGSLVWTKEQLNDLWFSKGTI